MTRRPVRVLLVDDYPDALETWTLFLQAAGYEVITATDGVDAVERAISAHPDVVVMDLDLPRRNGFDAAQDLKADPSTSGIPLIAATGYSSSGLKERAATAGFSAVLVKPCDPDRMLWEIDHALAREVSFQPHGNHTSATG